MKERYYGLFGSAFALCVASGLTLSPALISIGIGGLSLLGLLQINRNSLCNYLSVSWVAFFVLLLVSFFQETHLDDFWVEVRIKLPFLLVPIGWAAIQRFSPKQRLIVEFTFILAVTITAIATLINYIANYQEINNLVERSQEVPIKPNMSHIYYSMLAAWATVLSLYHFKTNTVQAVRWISLFVAVFLFCCMHVFAARTGLIALYAGAVVLLFAWVLREKRYFWMLAGLLFLTAAPILAYVGSASFQKRIGNTQEDIGIWQSGGDISWRSVSMRLATWQMGWKIFQENTLLGVGTGDAKYVLEEKYIQNKVQMKPECYLHDFHNQWIETGVGLGAIGLLLLANIVLGANWRQPFSYRRLVFWTIVLAAMLAESILERQVGVSFVTLFSFWELHLAENSERGVIP